MLELVEHQGMKLFRINLALIRQHRFLSLHIDDLSDNAIHIARLIPNI